MSDVLRNGEAATVAFTLRSKSIPCTERSSFASHQRDPANHFILATARTKAKLEAIVESWRGRVRDESGEADDAPGSKETQRLFAVHKQIAEEPNGRPAKNSDLLFQFRLTLLDVAPAIWRRIQVGDCDLADLHYYIQAAFGWWNEYMHEFIVEGSRFGMPMPDDLNDGEDMKDETTVSLSGLLQTTLAQAGRQPSRGLNGKNRPGVT